jgi:DNA modification methylase
MSKRQRQEPIEYETRATPRTTTADGVPVFCAFDAILPVREITPNPGNPNHHGVDQIERLGNIIRATGWRNSITISNRSGMIVKGHGRLEAAKWAGMTEAPVEYQDYDSEAEEWADLVADNRLAELSTLDTGELIDMINQIDTGEVPVEMTGYTPEDIEDIIAAMGGEGDAEDDGADSVPSVSADYIPMTKPGDIWHMGSHRLLCGSATDDEAVARLMDGEKAQLVHTDPPYGVSYETQSGKFDMIANDDLDADALMQLLIPAFKNYAKYTDDDAAFYIWHAFTAFRDFDDAMTAAGIMKKQYIIWWKPAPVLGHADYQWAHEPCFYAQKAGQQCHFYGDRAQRTTWKAVLRGADGTATTLSGGVVLTDGQGGKVYLSSTPPKGKKIRYIRLSEGRSVLLYPESKESTVWEVARETKTEHPTQKPVEIPLTAITNSSQTGDLVIDFFGGSGSTMIAAEMAGRRCYTIELDPKYCDVIVNRYVKLTGNIGVTLERGGEMLPYGPIKDQNDLDNGVVE